MIKDNFEQLLHGSKIRLAYAKHEVHLYKENQSEIYGLLICVPMPEIRSKRYKGFNISGDYHARGYILSMSEPEANLSIFSALVEYLLEKLVFIDTISFATFQSIIDEWRSFVEGENFSISGNIQIGIFGELLFLKELIQRRGEKMGLISWTGPEKSKVDFTLSRDYAVEIKSSKDPLNNEVTISSIHQLSSGFLFHFLRRYGLVETMDGMTIMDLYILVNSMLMEYELKAEFRMKLISSGFNPSKYYEDLLKLEMVSVVDYDVQENNFPKIVPPLHDKIIKLSYTISLDSQMRMNPTELFETLNF
jgi:hypothetical protein